MKIARFSTAKAFTQLRTSSRRFESGAFSALVAVAPDGLWRFAAVASKARIGGAVARNRAKRRLRAAFSKAATPLETPLAVVCHAKKAVLSAEFSQIFEELSRALRSTQGR